eukprot:TRINITY_DN312_c0_g1_i1.p2 TRINITY_DN312_c0_g1~~TRINITY_DN312_c0_g1_i1.p2  ORF type:complete len:432 (+),score=133.43 TRINITY_DN312_c0_g1_i1:142-1437(+)
MAALQGANDFDKLDALTKRTYAEQAKWFLNSFWEPHAKEVAERVWDYAAKCAEVDAQKHAEGNELDELNGHRLLEAFDEALTVRSMRTNLRETGAIGDKVRFVPLIHVLLFRYKEFVDWKTMVNCAQGNVEELQKAQDLLTEVQAAFAESERRAGEARQALVEAQSRESAAKAAEADAIKREQEAIASETAAKASEVSAVAEEEQSVAKEAASKVAEIDAAAAEAAALVAKQEQQAALALLAAAEKAYNDKTIELTKKSEEGGLVSRNRAKNELAQHLGTPTLALRSAKINSEAAVRKADKAAASAAAARTTARTAAIAATAAREAAEVARAAATAARVDAEHARAAAASARQAAEAAAAAAAQARLASEEAKAAADAALDAASAKLAEAEEYLRHVKENPSGGEGTVWWIERALYESKKYLPLNKGGVAR